MPLPEPTARFLSRAGWIAGVPLLALVWGGATWVAAPGIAARVAEEGEAVARTTQDPGGEPWLRIAVQGRDLRVRGEAPGETERAAVLARLAALPSPRRIVSEIGLIEAVSPFAWAAERGAHGVAITGSRPAEIGRRVLAAQIAAALPGQSLDDATRAARNAPPDFSAAIAYAAARLGGFKPGGRVSVTDTVIAASGEAVDKAAYEALRSAFAAPPPGYGIGRIDILPPATADFRFAVERIAGGGLVLTGHTVSEAARAEIRRAAEAANDGAPVEDRLQTARGPMPDGETQALAAAMLRAAGLMARGRVAFADGRVSAQGDAVDGQAVGEVAALLRAQASATVSAGPVDLAVVPLSPYRVSIRREPERVSIGGHLPDAESRARILARLGARFFREGILDRTRLAAGAPPGLDAALEAAVPVLANLAEGEIRVADRSLRLTGTSLYRESAARAGDALRRTMPPGWSASASVEPREPPVRPDPQACRAGLDGIGSALRFAPGSLALTPAMYPALDGLAARARACPDLRIAVSGHADPPGPKPAKPAEDAKAAPPPAPETPAKPARGKKVEAAPKPVAPAEPAPEELARMRAQVVAEYLFQAGAGLDQVVLADEAPGERRSVAIVLRP